MAGNASLRQAKRAKNDEFYTQYADIEAEMNAYYEYDHERSNFAKRRRVQ